MNNSNDFDIIEIGLKDDLGIPLCVYEKKWYDNLDEQIKSELHNLVNNASFLDEIRNVLEQIIKKASVLPLDEQEYIKLKCNEKINQLEFSTSKISLMHISNAQKNNKC